MPFLLVTNFYYSRMEAAEQSARVFHWIWVPRACRSSVCQDPLRAETVCDILPIATLSGAGIVSLFRTRYEERSCYSAFGLGCRRTGDLGCRRVDLHQDSSCKHAAVRKVFATVAQKLMCYTYGTERA
jgi:hypothetical protein